MQISPCSLVRKNRQISDRKLTVISFMLRIRDERDCSTISIQIAWKLNMNYVITLSVCVIPTSFCHSCGAFSSVAKVHMKLWRSLALILYEESVLAFCKERSCHAVLADMYISSY